jgi:hypothetical protein
VAFGRNEQLLAELLEDFVDHIRVAIDRADRRRQIDDEHAIECGECSGDAARHRTREIQVRDPHFDERGDRIDAAIDPACEVAAERTAVDPLERPLRGDRGDDAGAHGVELRVRLHVGQHLDQAGAKLALQRSDRERRPVSAQASYRQTKHDGDLGALLQ